MPRPKKISVRRIKLPHLHGQRWRVDCGIIGGKRVRPIFQSRQDAETFATAQREKLKQHGETSAALTEPERILFQHWRDRLAAVGATIAEAGELLLAQRKPMKPPHGLAELMKLCVETKRLEGASDGYLKTFRCSCGSFIAGRETMPETAVTREMVKAWVTGNGWEARTQRGYLGDVRTLLSFAVTERTITANPLAGEEGFITLAKIADREIAAFSSGICERLLMTALCATERRWNREQRAWEPWPIYRRLLGYLAIATFAGIRPKEVNQSKRTAIDVEGMTVVVEGRIAKTLKRRVVDLSANAVEWLRLWLALCPDEPMIIPKNFKRLFDGLRARADIGEWPHDVLRHTFATMHYAQHKSASMLKAELGHSEDEQTLERHYRALRTTDGRVVNRFEALLFWETYPPPRYREAAEMK